MSFREKVFGFSKQPPKAASTTEDQLPTADAPIALALDGLEMRYDQGVWHTDVGAAPASMRGVIDENKRLKAENRKLAFKVELLLDMLAAERLDVLHLYNGEDVPHLAPADL